MNKIENMLNKMCPNGVKYKTLADIANVSKGKQLNKNLLSNDGNYPVLNGGQNYSGYWNDYNTPADTIAISQGGASAGFVSWIDMPFWAGAHCYVITPHEHVNNRYLYHFLKSQEKTYQEAQYGAGIPALAAKTLNNTLVPVPPLAIQVEVARVLDTFVALTDELTDELTARKEQYDYYRDTLLNDKNLNKMNGGKVEKKKLGDIVDNFNNLRKPVRRDNRSHGAFPYYGANGIQDYVDDYIFDGVFLLVGEDGSVITKDGHPIINWAEGKIWVNNHAHILAEKQDSNVSLRYIKYTLEHTDITELAHGVPPKLTKNQLMNIDVPVPSLETQQKIVSILDRFNTLTTSLVDGLPGEIAANNERYEYYRDRLLDFPRCDDDGDDEVVAA